MATAPIWLAKREKLRDSRKDRNAGCLSRAPAPTGIREDMVRPVSCFSKRGALPESASIVVDYAVAEPGPLVNGLPAGGPALRLQAPCHNTGGGFGSCCNCNRGSAYWRCWGSRGRWVKTAA